MLAYTLTPSCKRISRHDIGCVGQTEDNMYSCSITASCMILLQVCLRSSIQCSSSMHKNHEFGYTQMAACLQLTAMDHNCNNTHAEDPSSRNIVV